jgi:hypothetical protein
MERVDGREDEVSGNGRREGEKTREGEREWRLALFISGGWFDYWVGFCLFTWGVRPGV